MHKAVARTRADGAVGGIGVHAVFGGQHHGFTGRHQVDEGQHVGDHLHHRGVAHGAHVNDLAAHGAQQRFDALEGVFFTADQHGDFTRVGQVNTARDGALQHRDPAGFGQFGQALEVLQIGGAHLDPNATRFEVRQHALRAFDHVARNRRRRQDGDDHLGVAAHARHIIGPLRTGGDQALGVGFVQIGHGHGIAGFDQAVAQAFTEAAQADEAHGGLVGCVHVSFPLMMGC